MYVGRGLAPAYNPKNYRSTRYGRCGIFYGKFKIKWIMSPALNNINIPL